MVEHRCRSCTAGKAKWCPVGEVSTITRQRPGSTRFYMVLQKGTTPGASPAGDRRGSARSPAPNNNVPSLEELLQLLELKREMSQMYEQAGAPDGSEPPPLVWADYQKAVERIRGT